MILSSENPYINPQAPDFNRSHARYAFYAILFRASDKLNFKKPKC